MEKPTLESRTVKAGYYVASYLHSEDWGQSFRLIPIKTVSMYAVFSENPKFTFTMIALNRGVNANHKNVIFLPSSKNANCIHLRSLFFLIGKLQERTPLKKRGMFHFQRTWEGKDHRNSWFSIKLHFFFTLLLLLFGESEANEGYFPFVSSPAEPSESNSRRYHNGYITG